MDHAHIENEVLLSISVDAYSGWPQIVKVKNREAKTVMNVLRVICARDGVPEQLVSDNAPEFHDETLCSWLNRIGCKPVKTLPHHHQSNGAAERMVSTIKMGLKAFITGR